MSEDKPTLLSCGILREEIEALISRGELDAKAHFLNRELHSDQGRLKDALDQALENRKKRGGLCRW